MDNEDRSPKYAESSLTLAGAVMLGTGVMIGAGIFSLTGQMAEALGLFVSHCLPFCRYRRFLQRLFLRENVRLLSLGRRHRDVFAQSLRR